MLTTVLHADIICSKVHNKEALMDTRDIGFIIKNISECMDKKFNEELKALGITCSQMRILSYLLKNKDKNITQHQIETYLKISHPTTVGLINRLEGKEFITCEISNEDKRQKIVRLREPTDGQRRNMEKRARAEEEYILRGFSNEEKTELKRLLCKLYNNISEEAKA